jgi:tetratricopeptide (TPR) repeat protein
MNSVELPKEELERMVFFEEARKLAESDHDKDPADAQVLTRWGGALLELAHFRHGSDAVEMIELAVGKFEAALKINPKKHDALWCLGNALTSQGFLFKDQIKAEEFFDEAKSCFQRALNEEPTNDIYRKALEMTDKAPGLHAELQRQMDEQMQEDTERPPQSHAGSHAKKRVSSESWYDVGGWICFAGIALSWVMLLRQPNEMS